MLDGESNTGEVVADTTPRFIAMLLPLGIGMVVLGTGAIWNPWALVVRTRCRILLLSC